MDLACPQGTPVAAAADGVVTLADPSFHLHGKTIIVDHGQGVSTLYLHLSEIDVTPGQAVKQGEVIGVPQIVTRGWAYDKDTEAILEEARKQVTRALEQALSSGNTDHETLNRVARKALGKLVGERTRQRPMIVPVIVTV